MKKSQIKLISLACAVIMMLSCFTAGASADVICLHETEKTLVAEGDGYTVANVCALCGKKVTEEGYVNSGTALNFYSDSANTDAYTDEELAIGFSKASGSTLYTGSNIISSSGTPYWLTFDFKVNALPDIPEGNAQADLANADSRAYKGWSVVCMIISGSYIAPLRLIPDGWEADSGATGTTKGTTDGKAPIKYFGNVYREQDTVVDIKAGDSVSFAMRVDPVSGAYDVYVDNIFAGSGKMTAKASGTNDHIRLWEGDGNNYGADLDFTNIKVFKDSYTAAVHTHEYTEIIEFYDEGVYKYESCDCGNRNELESEQITAVVADGLAHIYDGFGNFTVNADSYWFVTDVNIRGKVSDGALLTFGTDTVLEVSDGKLVSGTSTIGAITYPTAYQAAVEITNNSYSLYINGIYAVSGTLTDTQNITCGSESFGHHVRFLYNKAVILGDGTSVVPTYTADESIKLCYHSDEGINAKNKILAHTNNGVKYIYNCALCGERVYSMLKKDLTNPANDMAYRYKPNALMRSEFESFTTSTSKYLYLENNIISKTALPYWVTFDITPKSLPSNDTGDLNNPNTRSYKGYGLFTTEATFMPATELRVIPDGWETGNASGTTKGETDGKCEVKVIAPLQGFEASTDAMVDNIHYRRSETVAYLEVGKTTSFALRIDPVTGNYDVYVNGIYKASSDKPAGVDMTPKMIFHDNGMGEFIYSNISVCEEAHNFDNKVAAIELTAKFEADESSSANAYTAISSIKRGDEKYSFFYANNKTANLAFKDENGNFVTLYDVDGNIVSLAEGKKLAVVYDDINGDVRYFVEGMLARYQSGEKLVYAEGIKVYNADFVNAEGGNDALCFNPTKVSDVNISGLGMTDTAEMIGFQPNDLDNSIRLIAGLDSLYYGSVGYEVRAYKADGTSYSTKSTVKSSNTVYSSVKADGVTLPATKYGYTYLSALSIDGDFLGYKDSYIIVKPFTKVGNNTYYGKEAILNILDNGRYEFAENE